MNPIWKVISFHCVTQKHLSVKEECKYRSRYYALPVIYSIYMPVAKGSRRGWTTAPAAGR